MFSFGFHRSPLLCAFGRLCLLCILFELYLYLWPIACFCKNLMLNISFGCCRHSVSNTFVQLTEGRSARDQPKQPPAKKTRSSNLINAFTEGVSLVSTRAGLNATQSGNGFELLRQLTCEYSLRTRSEALALRAAFSMKSFQLSAQETSPLPL